MQNRFAQVVSQHSNASIANLVSGEFYKSNLTNSLNKCCISTSEHLLHVYIVYIIHGVDL